MRSERGGILSKTVVFLLVLGLIAFEGGAVVVARLQADGTARNAADEAAIAYGSTGSTAKAEARAREEAARGGAELLDFTLDTKELIVTVTLRKVAKTLILQRIGSLEKKGVVVVTASGRVR